MNWQAGTMLHPGAQQREHRKNVSAYRKIRHAEATTERGNQAAHHALNPSTSRVSPSHGHQGSIPIELFNAKNNLITLSVKWGEDQLGCSALRQTASVSWACFRPGPPWPNRPRA